MDLWGGVADEETGRPWAGDSIIVVASSTKGATAIMNKMQMVGDDDPRP